jgi:hypothetical protein
MAKKKTKALGVMVSNHLRIVELFLFKYFLNIIYFQEKNIKIHSLG